MTETSLTETSHELTLRPRPHVVSAGALDRFGTLEALGSGGRWAETRSLKLSEKAETTIDVWHIATS